MSGAPIDFWTKCPEATLSSGQRPRRGLAVSYIHTVLRGRYFKALQRSINNDGKVSLVIKVK